MKKLVFLFLFFVPLSSYGFDYHGIKSGMSRAEVQNLTGCESSKYGIFSQCSWEEVGTNKIFNTTMGINPPYLWFVSFSFTSDSKLWRIQLSFREQSGASGVAQIKALTELYPYAEPQKKSEKPYSSITIKTVVVLIIDSALFKSDVEKIYKEKIDKY